MLVEQRRYTVSPGRTADYLHLYQTVGMPVQLRYLPVMLGYYSSEIGSLNQIVHLWGHDGLDVREASRARMRADPAFQDYWAQIRPLIISQTSEILRPASFFAARLARMAEVAGRDTADGVAAQGYSA